MLTNGNIEQLAADYAELQADHARMAKRMIRLETALEAIRDDGMPDPELYSDQQALKVAWALIKRLQTTARAALKGDVP